MQENFCGGLAVTGWISSSKSFGFQHSLLHHCSVAWSSLTAAEVYYAHNLSAHYQNWWLSSAIWLCSAKEMRCFNFTVYQVGRVPSHKNIKLKDKWLLLQKIYISARTNTGNNYLWTIAIISWINKVFLHSNQSNYQVSINGSIATQFLELWQRISCKSLFFIDSVFSVRNSCPVRQTNRHNLFSMSRSISYLMTGQILGRIRKRHLKPNNN